MRTIDKIRAALATRPGRMPSEAWRRAALTLMHGRALDLPDAEFDALAVTLGLTDAGSELEARRAPSAQPSKRASAQVSGTRVTHSSAPEQPSAQSERAHPSEPSAASERPEQPSTGDALTWGAA